MLNRAIYKLLLAYFAVLAMKGTALAGPEPEECLGCHDADEYVSLDAAELLEDLQDPGIRQHLEYADITLEQVEVLLAASRED